MCCIDAHHLFHRGQQYQDNINDNNNANIRGLSTQCQNVQMGFMIEFHEGISEAFCIEVRDGI